MGEIEVKERNVTSVKFDPSSKSLRLLDETQRPEVEIASRDVVHVAEKIEDVAPFFLCYYREKSKGFSVLKAIKVFTVFIEHEGVPHLRKYENILKKLKAGFLAERRNVTRALLVVEDEKVKKVVGGEADSGGQAAALLKEAGINYELTVRNGRFKKDGILNQGYEEIFLTRPPPSDANDSISSKTSQLTNGVHDDDDDDEDNDDYTLDDPAVPSTRSALDRGLDSSNIPKRPVNASRHSALPVRDSSAFGLARWTLYLIPAIVIAGIAILYHYVNRAKA